jgi:hypothetical protein
MPKEENRGPDTAKKLVNNQRSLSDHHKLSVLKAGQQSLIIKACNELLRFGIRVMQKPLAKLSKFVIAPLFTRKWLVNKPVLGEFVSEPPRNLFSRGGVVTMYLTQAKPDSLRGDNSPPMVQHIEDVPVSLRHPWDRWRHLI